MRRHPLDPRTRTLAAVGLLGGLAVIMTACGSGNGSYAGPSTPSTTATASGASTPYGAGTSGDATATSSGDTVAVRSDATLGQILVDSKGRTLYLFEKDTGTGSTCFDACAAAWPPLTANGQPKVGDGAQASLLGTSSRSDGSTQVTYGGHPLYYYEGDSKAGATTGEGIDAFGAEWYVVSPDGQKVEPGGS